MYSTLDREVSKYGEARAGSRVVTGALHTGQSGGYRLLLVLVGLGWVLHCHKVVLICCLVFVRGVVCAAMVSEYSIVDMWVGRR